MVMGAMVACSGDDGGSGLSDATSLTAVPADQRQALCEEFAALWPVRTLTCSGQEVQWGVQADCSNAANEAPPAECADITVGQMRDCFAAMGDLSDMAICAMDPPPPVCGPLLGSPCFSL